MKRAGGFRHQRTLAEGTGFQADSPRLGWTTAAFGRGTGEGSTMSALGATTEGVPTVVTTARILDLVAREGRAQPGVPLLIRGERGVGKGIVARLIHSASPRRAHSFIKVNCAVDPPDRLEADLFGHEKGTSPRAIRRRLGSFEFANHGTIYLEEIGRVPQTLVPKLLHVLRTGEVSRCGSREVIKVDVRLIASTARCAENGGADDLWQELSRLNAIEISIPPLRERAEEIPLFASFFLEQFNRQYRRDVQLRPDVMATFTAHSWPGNIRELENAVHRLVANRAKSFVR
jgi:DNA-binding NtrC family response regulator